MPIRMRSAAISNGPGVQSTGAAVTAVESPFRNPKSVALTTAGLVGYKVFADLAGKGSLFVITIVAARRLTPWGFGLFGVGSTLGWMLAVIGDFGVQMHLARAVAQTPRDAGSLLRRWFRLRLIATVAILF